MITVDVLTAVLWIVGIVGVCGVLAAISTRESD